MLAQTERMWDAKTMVTVFGSLNVDYVFSVDELAQPGETVLANALDVLPGGKGGNQALAAAKAGADVCMIGATGQDRNGETAIEGLRDADVDLSRVKHATSLTGTAAIKVDRHGENSIAVFPGANTQASADQVPDELLHKGTTLVLQMEVPAEEIAGLIRRAIARDAKIILNFAPAAPIELNALKAVDCIIVNQTEFRAMQSLLGETSNNIDEGALSSVAHALEASIIVTLGARGLLAFHNKRALRIPALKVDAIDTVGAGDAFVGVFAAMCDTGHSFESALRYGSVAGALACTKRGAQSAAPDLDALEAAIRELL